MAWLPSARGPITAIAEGVARSSRPSRAVCFACQLRSRTRLVQTARYSSSTEDAGKPLATSWDGLRWHGLKKPYIRKKLVTSPRITPFVPFRIPEDRLKQEFVLALLEVVLTRQCGFDLSHLDQTATNVQWATDTVLTLSTSDSGPAVSFNTVETGEQALTALGLIQTPSAAQATEEPLDPIEETTSSEQLHDGEDQPGRNDEEVSAINSELGKEANLEHAGAEELDLEPGASELLDASSNVTIEVEDQEWKSIPLDDLAFRFAVMKRVSRRTGRRVPDFEIPRCLTAEYLYSVVSRDQKPRNLAETVQEGGILGHPNLKLHPQEFTDIDNDVTLGRWKIIREELRARDLPEFIEKKDHPQILERDEA